MADNDSIGKAKPAQVCKRNTRFSIDRELRPSDDEIVDLLKVLNNEHRFS